VIEGRQRSFDQMQRGVEQHRDRPIDVWTVLERDS
jgi:hypothetical protein